MALFVDIEKEFRGFHLRAAFRAEDEVFALLGPSGCGKSMTLRCIAGIERPDRGRIILDERVLFDSEQKIDIAPQKRKTGYLFQDYALFPNMTVRQNIRCGLPRGGNEDEICRIAEEMELTNVLSLHPAQLSGGQKQRTALARILAGKPDILMLDEPFSALDTHLRFRLEQKMREIMRSFGKTVLLISHDRDEVFRMADSIAVMEQGTILSFGEKHAVFADPETVSGARLTGCKNISPVELCGENSVYAKDWGIRIDTGRPVSETAYAGVRMHDLKLGEGENTYSAKVCEVVENPFSYTVMLLFKEGKEPMGIELEKPVWEAACAEELTVHIPCHAVLLLKGPEEEMSGR